MRQRRAQHAMILAAYSASLYPILVTYPDHWLRPGLCTAAPVCPGMPRPPLLPDSLVPGPALSESGAVQVMILEAAQSRRNADGFQRILT